MKKILHSTKLFSFVFVLLVGASVSGLGIYRYVQTQHPNIDIAAQNKYEEKIYVSMSGDYPPFCFSDENGALTGYNLELMNALANEMQLNIEIKTYTWPEPLQALDEGEVSITPGMEYQPTYYNRYLLSKPLYNETYVAYGLKPYSHISTLSSKKIGYISYSPAYDLVLKPMGLFQEAQEYPTYLAALEAVLAGELDYVIGKFSVVQRTIATYNLTGIAAMGPVLGNNASALGLRSDNQALLDQVNTALDALAAQGTLDYLSNKWLGAYVDEPSLSDYFKQHMVEIGFAITVSVIFMMVLSNQRQQRRRKAELLQLEVEKQRTNAYQAALLQAQVAEQDKVQALETVQKNNQALMRMNEELQQSKSITDEALHIAEEANRSKSIFLSNMSHDIRTPMNAVVGFATLLANGVDDKEKVKDYTRKIITSSQHLLGLINDVLDMSKIEAGKTHLNVSEVNMGEVIEQIDLMIRPQMQAKAHEFEVIVETIVHEALILDQLRLHQILLNLLSNAMKYTPDGGKITLAITELEQRSKALARYRFQVIDNGIGMSDTFVSTIFDAFTREENSTTNTIQGTGLGMAITKNIIDLMGGKIGIDSKKAQGTTITIELEFSIQELSVDPNFWNNHHIHKLLVVDDEEVFCENVQLSMAHTGVVVDYVLSGEAAITKIQTAKQANNGYDFVLLDWKMPGMDGVATAKEIRNRISKTVPVLVLTSYDWSEIEEEARAVGIDTFLQKPFFVHSFKKRIEQLAQQQEETSSLALETKGLEGIHILLAEDNALNLEIITQLLQKCGATCDAVVDGKQAVNRFLQTHGVYDLILMDIQMPIMNGYDACRAIRNAEHREAKTIPIIAMTANTFAEDVKDAMDAGMNAHIAKPVDMQQLEQTVKMLRVS